MKPGDALILDGNIHLVVAMTTETVSIQSPDGVITEYTREKLIDFLCGAVPKPKSLTQDEVEKIIKKIRDAQRYEDMYAEKMRKSSPWDGRYPETPDGRPPWRQPSSTGYPGSRRDSEKEIEEHIREFIEKTKHKW